MTHALNRSEFGNPANKGNLMSIKDAGELLNDWVNTKYSKKTSLFWSEYIFHVLSKKDAAVARKMTLQILRECVTSYFASEGTRKG